MVLAEVRHETSAVEEGGLVMELWQAEKGRSQKTALLPASKSTPLIPSQLPAMSPGVHASSASGLHVRNHELYEQGPIVSLSRSLMETLRLILSEVRMQSDTAQHYGSLESSCAALFFWDTDLGLSRGELDDMLQDSPQLRNTCLTVLVSISQFASTCTWIVHDPLYCAIADTKQH
jgi:hypothetical protein